MKKGFFGQATGAVMLMTGAWLAMAGSASAATCIGSCGVSGANGDVSAPPGGGSYSWISTAGGVNGAGQLPSIGGTNGSQLTSGTFSGAAGQNLGYTFKFVTSDGQAGAGSFIYQDYAWVKLLNAVTNATVATLFTARTEPAGSIVPGKGLPAVASGVSLHPATVPISSGSGAGGAPVWAPLGGSSGTCWGAGCGLTSWVASNYTLQSSGLYKVVFGVSNWGDTAYDTGLAIAGLNIQGTAIEDNPGSGGVISGVPEPRIWAMLILGFGMVAAMMRRRGSLARD